MASLKNLGVTINKLSASEHVQQTVSGRAQSFNALMAWKSTPCNLSSSPSFLNLLQNFHLAVIEYLYRGRRAVPLQTFTTGHSNRKLSIVMALSTTFTQCAVETTKFRRITQNKGHFAVQGHRFWYQSKGHIQLPIPRR